MPVRLPLILGHEGAGVVEKVGSGVDDLAVDDHVVLSMMASCGSCRFCVSGQPALCGRGQRAALGGTMPDGTSRLRQGDETYAHCFASRPSPNSPSSRPALR